MFRGQAGSVLLAVLMKSSREQIEEYLAQGAHVWDVAVFFETAVVYQNTQKQIVEGTGSLEDPAVLPGFKLHLSEILRERPE